MFLPRAAEFAELCEPQNGVTMLSLIGALAILVLVGALAILATALVGICKDSHPQVTNKPSGDLSSLAKARANYALPR
jgi:hypothetical protein